MTELEETRIQASNACLALFEYCFEDELKHAPYEIVRAWQIGKKIHELVTNPTLPK